VSTSRLVAVVLVPIIDRQVAESLSAKRISVILCFHYRMTYDKVLLLKETLCC